MREGLGRYLGGYLQVRMTGFSQERFLNLCMARGIGLWDVSRDGDGCRFFLTVKDFRGIRPLARKARARLRIVRRVGLPFFLYENRKRKLYGAGVAAFFLVLLFLSRFVWNISVEGNTRFTDDTLIRYLETLDIRCGRPKDRIDCDSLEEAIRGHYPEIIWVSARISGTRLQIRVKENQVTAAIPVKDESPRDLVADRAGIVTRMIVRKGKAKVKPGDEVKAGDVLISGRIPIENDAGEVVNEQLTRADGDIYARVEENYRESFPRFAVRRVETGQRRHGVRLRLGSLTFLWMLPAFGDNPWEITTDSRQVTVLGDFYLPVWVDLIAAREYQTYERQLTAEEAEAVKKRVHSRKMEILKEKDIQMIENRVKMVKKDSQWEIQGDFVLEEKIGTGSAVPRPETFPEETFPAETGAGNPQ